MFKKVRDFLGLTALGSWLGKYFSDSREVEDRTVVGSIILGAIVACVYVHLTTGRIIQPEILYTLAAILGGAMGFSVVLASKVFKRSKETNTNTTETSVDKNDNIVEKEVTHTITETVQTPIKKDEVIPIPPIQDKINTDEVVKVELVKPEDTSSPIKREAKETREVVTSGIKPIPTKVHILTEAEIVKRFGKHCDETNFVKIPLPYPMKYGDSNVTKITCHKKVAAPFTKVFEDILEHYGLPKIQELGIDKFGGVYNCRAMRGGDNWSTHAWAIAIDLDPQRNQLKETHKTARFARPEYKPMIDIFYKHGFISLGIERDFDWMHFQYNKV